MNPTLITLCGLAQLVILYNQSPWSEGLAIGLGIVAIQAMFAYTRLRWDSHLDMFLIMLGPGGLGMLAATKLAGEPACHGGGGWSGFLSMSAGMALASVPLSWFQARCLTEARSQGRGGVALALDLIGMQAGMALGHFPSVLFPAMTDSRAVWLHHGLMLTAMSLGMLGAAFLQAVWLRPRLANA
jgi:hypothetical protein